MFITIIIFIILLSVLVFAHELGHFLTARFFGVKAEEFGFGFPPRIFGIQLISGKKIEPVAGISEEKITVTSNSSDADPVVSIEEKNTAVKKISVFKRWRLVMGASDPQDCADEQIEHAGTIYSFNWLPLGGFVKIKGEQGESHDADSLLHKPIWQRAIIMSAGVAMNLIIAAIMLAVGFMIGLPQSLDGISAGAKIEQKNLQIIQVVPGSPAEAAGLTMGDGILAVNGQKFNAYEELSGFVSKKEGQKLQYEIKRGRENLRLEITPKIMAETGRAGIGIAVAETGIVRYPWYQAIWEGIKTTVFMTWYVIIAFFTIIKNLLVGQGAGAEVSGPVGIAIMTGQVARLGLVYILQFAAMLSVNLAIVNYLPLPALDGGRVLFLIIEKLRGRAVPEKVEAAVHNVGFMLLILLVVIVTFKDMFKFSDKFISLFQKIF
ncbi:RIP metalloprotease RseP [Candidatus Falkowbacteria bacterium CG10_big_fil_rev_8_21_14_0_10_43_11]|uniref:Zinc metalloprotease n=1 Tax=Candidatus Falkowbacteria bacterium CG10_big_fil_rev_8_21_14_0_10_43_11 TaxID=1974568 RepID=A0A2M6WMB9_9BACT|nr:MAG: RIP metalloprotease RseP [Candidatus Falkowbacteria bacterium CG10_big_fil_rev_8_21_14_0_10_43_11]